MRRPSAQTPLSRTSLKPIPRTLIQNTGRYARDRSHGKTDHEANPYRFAVRLIDGHAGQRLREPGKLDGRHPGAVPGLGRSIHWPLHRPGRPPLCRSLVRSSASDVRSCPVDRLPSPVASERSAVRFGAPHELPCGGHPNCHKPIGQRDVRQVGRMRPRVPALVRAARRGPSGGRRPEPLQHTP